MKQKLYSIDAVRQAVVNKVDLFEAPGGETLPDEAEGQGFALNEDEEEGTSSITLFEYGGGAGDVSWWTIKSHGELDRADLQLLAIAALTAWTVTNTPH